jgi:hypothetical protein
MASRPQISSVPTAGRPVTFSAIDVQRDIGLALAHAERCPHTPVAAAIRSRLCAYINGLAAPAEQYVDTLPGDTRAHDVAENTVRYARNLARQSDENDNGDPAARLHLLAKGANSLLRYAQFSSR